MKNSPASLYALGLITLFALPYGSWGASVSQSTQGSCSPAVADVKGSVNITCNGVDQATVDKVIRLLNEILKDRKKLDEIQQQVDKTSKRTDALEVRQASRRVTASQTKQLVATLSGKSSVAIEIIGLANNAEAMQYAEDLAHVLVASGWNIRRIGSRNIIGTIPIGLSIRVHDSKSSAGITATTLLDAFREADIDVTLLERPRMAPDTIVLMVGNKTFN